MRHALAFRGSPGADAARMRDRLERVRFPTSTDAANRQRLSRKITIRCCGIVVLDCAALHRLGRDANQGEVGLVVDGTYHGISRFDPA